MGVNRPDFGAAISVLDAIKLSLPQDRRHRSDRTAIGLLTAALREGSIQPSKIPAHLDRFDHALRNTTDQGQLETLRQAHAQLSALLHADAAPASSTAAARLAADDSILHPKQIKPDNLFIHGSGVVALMSGKAGDEKRPMLVLQSPQWAVRKLFGQDVKAFLGAGSSLNLQTGIHETEFEFPGYLLKFLLGRTANFILFNDEIGDATSIVNRSYLGRTWNLVQDTLAKSFPKGADVPDLDAEVRQLEAPFPAVGEGGLWGFTGIERGGEVQIENWRLRHLGNRKWRIHESHKYIGDIDLADYPIQQPTRPTFMEDVIKDRKLAKIRYEALFEGKPMIVPLGSGSGLTQEEASSHLSIDEAGNVTIVDPNVNVIEDLVKLGIPFGRVKRIIVTHVHFDHVAGIWRLLRYLTAKPDLIIHANPGDVKKIRDGEIKDGDEMSTLTALFDMAEKATHRIINGAELLKGVNVVPIKFDQPMSVGTFTERFTFGNHTVPTVLRTILDPEGGKPIFLHTGDTRMHPEILHTATLQDADGASVSAMAPYRADALSNMVSWALLSGAAVLADAGVNPLHPSVNFYQRMKAAFQAAGITGKTLDGIISNLYLSHASKAEVEKSGFQYPAKGWAGAIDLSERLQWKKKNPETIKKQMIDHAVANIPVFANLGIRDLRELIKMGKIKRYRSGSRLMKQGARAESFSIILDGSAIVSKNIDDKHIPLQTLTSGLIGEAVFAGDRKRNARVCAMTDLTTLTFGKDAIDFLRDKGVAARLVHRREVMEQASAAPGKVAVLSELSPQTQSDVFLQGDMVRFAKGETILREGDTSKGLYVIFDGNVTVSASEGALAKTPVQLGRGDIIGEGTLLGGDVRSANVTANNDVQALFVDAASTRQIIDRDGVDLRYYLLGLVQKRKSVKSSAPPDVAVPTTGAPSPSTAGGGGTAGIGTHGPLQRHASFVYGVDALGGPAMWSTAMHMNGFGTLGIAGMLPFGMGASTLLKPMI